MASKAAQLETTKRTSGWDNDLRIRTNRVSISRGSRLKSLMKIVVETDRRPNRGFSNSINTVGLFEQRI